MPPVAISWLLLSSFSAWQSLDVVTAAFPVGPNRFLGTCLDEAWVTQMETSLGVSSQERDSSGRLVRPFMQQALKFPRYRVDDPRTASASAFSDSCIPAGQTVYGADQDAEGTTRGEVNGTLVMDMCNWDTHALATMVLAIVAGEVV
ncbi:hypothetical protein PHYBOEH_006021 [Phytophthora boehmeriae]|uniref:Uncharacterized protein n=1 Tax=Phytophthora boehmeriae TaxID=109152 RepID=A0A8T1WPA7_9STRA|nr:hypothetical protein PHYBOEH_006021 [Phytophthora boehmeriae]